MIDTLCIKCIGVGHIEIKPDQVGMLHRPELETANQRLYKVRIYEHGDGTLEAVRHPYRLRVLCPKCMSPRAKRDRGFNAA